MVDESTVAVQDGYRRGILHQIPDVSVPRSAANQCEIGTELPWL